MKVSELYEWLGDHTTPEDEVVMHLELINLPILSLERTDDGVVMLNTNSIADVQEDPEAIPDPNPEPDGGVEQSDSEENPDTEDDDFI